MGLGDAQRQGQVRHARVAHLRARETVFVQGVCV